MSRAISGSKFAVIGGAAGYGQAVVKMLCSNNASKVFVVDKSFSKDRAGEDKKNIVQIQADIAVESQVDKAFEQIKAQSENKVTSVVLCVLQPLIARLINSDNNTVKSNVNFRKAAEVSIFGRMQCLKNAASLLAASNTEKNRSIVCLSSIFSDDGQKGHVFYSSLLGALDSAILPTARDLSQFGIRINGLKLGFFDSSSGLLSQPISVRESIASIIPYPKRLGTSDDLTGAVKFLIENEYVNATNLRLDGGIRCFP
ncbi:MAG: hypothetical protein MHPSP_001509 [Paramarteilia canceri]